MYNRYIHQNDGSFQRRSVPDAPKPPKPEPPPPQKPAPPVAPSFSPPEPSGVPFFLRKLIPRDFDTGDLIVVLLLLLMAGDSSEEQNTALLTLALYFFM